MERAGARIPELSTGQLYLKEAGALDGDVQGVPGSLDFPLCLDNLGRSRSNTETHLKTRGDSRLLRGCRTRHYLVLIQQIRKLHPAFLEARCAGVREIVRDVIQVHLLGVHSGRSCV